MQFMGDILIFIILLILILLPFVLFILDIIFFIKKKEHAIFEMFAFFMGSAYILLAYWLWDLPDYQQPINLYGTASAHEPVNMEYAGALALFAIWGFLSYFILKFGRRKLPPIIEVFLLAGVYVGMALCIVWMVQLLLGVKWFLDVHLDSFDYFVIFCMCTVPAIFIGHCIHLMVHIVKEKAQKQEKITYKNVVLNSINRFLYKGANLFLVAFVALLPVLGILTMILVLFGQQPDSIILAFTKTSDWVLSGEIAPPPVAYDTHYLCTVSLRGHKKLVKPTRYGIRRNEKIVVNRQLCVANAFEQLIQERAPKFHRAVRNFYDTYGYPISKHINNAWSADVVYLLMKPLEWIFVFVLYLFDEKPEDRINSQYLPKK